MRDLKRIVKSSAEGVTIEVSEISGQFLHGTQRGRSKNGPHQPPIGAFRRVTERRRPIPRAIWALGFASLLMDVSSELIHSLLPVFMFTGLGVSTPTIGLLAAMIASTAPADLRATAYGCFNLASMLAGLLWDSLGRQFTFTAGALFSMVALAGIGLWRQVNIQ